ncbi:hypothetical protein OG225_43170 (plasmid) [Nocardia sp. NBC_01377]|uniref:hypothetical protein n=1 Tax=Nocardia sp. NBC_01377 TaxID=2903595 RepID=UPI002F9104D9
MDTITLPPYEMPTDYMRKVFVTELIKYMVGASITDPNTGNILDVRTCAVLVTGDDDVQLVADPDHLRSQLAHPEVCAALLEKWPDMRVLYQDTPRS